MFVDIIKAELARAAWVVIIIPLYDPVVAGYLMSGSNARDPDDHVYSSGTSTHQLHPEICRWGLRCASNKARSKSNAPGCLIRCIEEMIFLLVRIALRC